MHARTHDGRTPLHYATSPAVVALLKDCGADPLATDAGGATPFYAVLDKASRLDTAAVCACLDALASAPTPADTLASALARAHAASGHTIYHAAAALGNEDVLRRVATLLYPDMRGDDALVACCTRAVGPPRGIVCHAHTHGHTPLAQRLLQYGADCSGQDPLRGSIVHAACKAGDLQLANYALSCALWHAQGDQPPYPDAAAYDVHSDAPEAVAQLLAQRDAAGWQPLHCAVHSGCWRTVHMLLRCWGARAFDLRADKQESCHADGRQHMSAMHLAAYLGGTHVLWLLLACGYDASSLGPQRRSLLHYAALGPLQGAEGWLFSVAPRDARRLLPPGAILTAHSSKALQHHAHAPYAQVGALVLQLQPPDGADARGARPHHYAAAAGNATLLLALRQQLPADGWASADAAGRNVLHYLCAGGGDTLVEHLPAVLAAAPGCALQDAQDTQGRLPLHYAAQVRRC